MERGGEGSEASWPGHAAKRELVTVVVVIIAGAA